MGSWEWKGMLVGWVLLSSHHEAAPKGSREGGTVGCWGGKGVSGGESGSCSALTMELALHTSRVTTLRCCFSRVMAG